MVTIQVREAYADALEPLDRSVDEALRRLATERAAQRIAELQRKIRDWEEKYHCRYDLFAYRTTTDEGFVSELDSQPATQQWEADLMLWESHMQELDKWLKRLQSILTA
ncbi:MAG: hypothetical protein FJ030_18180 [Chloroflexi bacterium]|nr:hypothetical protein [Chloroflexota bacterium]